METKTLVEMVEQTRHIAELVSNHKGWQALYDKLETLDRDMVQVCEFDLEKLMAEAKKYIEDIGTGRKEEQIELIKQIRKTSKKIEEDTNTQKDRLEAFEKKILDSEISEHIPDHDMLFLQKECARYHGSIDTLQGTRSQTLIESEKIDALKGDDKDFMFDNNDIHQLRNNLKSLQRQDTVDVPRIKKNIDALEAFTIKALKNKLNEDNKKS